MEMSGLLLIICFRKGPNHHYKAKLRKIHISFSSALKTLSISIFYVFKIKSKFDFFFSFNTLCDACRNL